MKYRNAWEKYREETVDGDGGDGGNSADAGSADAGGDGAATGGDGGNTVQADWPADWRQKLPAYEKNAKVYDRFASPNALAESYLALKQKLDSGELKASTPYPDKGTAEEQVAWRKSHGIPEKAEDYATHFADGLVIGEADKPFVDDFLKAAHAANLDPAQVNTTLRWYYDLQEKNFAQIEEQDAKFLSESEDALRAEWGGEYRANINAIKGLLDTLPGDVRELFMGARLADGRAVLNHPDMARWLVSTAKTINPMASVVPGAGANLATAIEDEIASIEKVMRTDRKTYNNDLKMQQRLRDLYDARDRAKN